MPQPPNLLTNNNSNDLKKPQSSPFGSPSMKHNPRMPMTNTSVSLNSSIVVSQQTHLNNAVASSPGMKIIFIYF